MHNKSRIDSFLTSCQTFKVRCNLTPGDRIHGQLDATFGTRTAAPDAGRRNRRGSPASLNGPFQIGGVEASQVASEGRDRTVENGCRRQHALRSAGEAARDRARPPPSKPPALDTEGGGFVFTRKP